MILRRGRGFGMLLAILALLPGLPMRGGTEPGAARWWSLEPIARPAVPSYEGRNPIDAFIAKRLEQAGLEPSPEAGRSTLIRRVYFDLLGLPPTLEEVSAFERDTDPQAYGRLVDRLLDSPQYGERWARHWLDVVHYGDTHGYDKDQPRPNAWPYRDYVIRAFNGDKPYARFVQEQIAGDVLFPGTADGIEALGFISAGPWDLIGHAEVPETKTDGRIARHLDRDDMVANTMSTFNSMTVHCAQCHDHKFDPITAEDYYSLQAVFAALDRTNLEYDRDPVLNAQRTRLKAEARGLAVRRGQLEADLARAGGPAWEELRKKIAAARKEGNSGDRPEFGYHSAIGSRGDAVKWVQIDLGKPVSIARVVLAPCRDDFAGIGAGFGFPPRFKVEASDDPEFEIRSLLADRTGADFKNPGIEPQSYGADVSARYVRVTATELAKRSGDYIFALAELEVWNEAGTNVARGAKVGALDSIESPPRWAKANLTDGIYPAGRTNDAAAALAKMEAELGRLWRDTIPSEVRSDWMETTNRIVAVEHELAGMPKPNVVFVGGIHYGSGAFRGTGPDGGKPRPIAVLNRGDVRKPGKPANPGALSAIKVLPSRFALAADAPEGERRRALALWLTDPRHPLTWRSIVNRVWQYHFGRGLADTPNDFGRMGSRPSHPELLDWLAAEFRDGGQSFKALHRLILTSAAYRQVSRVAAGHENAVAADRENRLLWRMNRRKLEAEAIRDSVLLASGKLRMEMFGPGFQDFVVEKPEHSPHYQYHLYDPDDPRSHRRSIYRFIVRSQPQPFMATLDCADPSMLVEKRNESLTALQALALLNNGFMVAMAGHFAESVQARAATPEEQAGCVISRALSRPATDLEKRELAAFARGHGLANLCRLVFNLNEFAYVD